MREAGAEGVRGGGGAGKGTSVRRMRRGRERVRVELSAVMMGVPLILCNSSHSTYHCDYEEAREDQQLCPGCQ